MKNTKTTKTTKTYKLGGNCFTDVKELYTRYQEDKHFKCFTLFIRTYSTEEEISNLIRCIDPDSYAMILHNRDVNADGTQKEAHYHVLVYKKAGFRLTPFIKAFSQNTLIQTARNKTHCYEYLVHKNDPDKAQYSRSEVVEYHRGDDVFSRTEKERKNSQYAQMLEDMLTLSRRELALKYGRDYMLNYQRYEHFASVVRYEDTEIEVDTAVAEINKTFNPLEEMTVVSELDGDTIRLNVASWFASTIADTIEKLGTLPDSKDIVIWYSQWLTEYRSLQRELKRGLRV